jgi:hypothetical protein
MLGNIDKSSNFNSGHPRASKYSRFFKGGMLLKFEQLQHLISIKLDSDGDISIKVSHLLHVRLVNLGRPHMLVIILE